MGLRRVIAERVELIRYRLIERAEKEARERAIRARRYRFHAKNHVLDRRGGWTWSVEKESLENAVARRRQAERKEKRCEEALSFLPAGLSRAVARMSTGGEGEAARKAERGVRSRVRAFVAGFFESDDAGRLDYERLYPAEKAWDELVREAKAAAEEVERMMMADMEAAEGVMHTDAFESVRRRVAENAPIRSEWPPRLSEEDISEREREFFESLGAGMAPRRVPIEELPVYPDPDPADEARADPAVDSAEDIGALFDRDMGLVADGESADASPAREDDPKTSETADPDEDHGADSETPDPAETALESETTAERAARPRVQPWPASLFSPRGLAEAGGLALQPAYKGGRVVCPLPIYEMDRAAEFGAEPKSGGKTSFRAETILRHGAELDDLLPLTARSILVPPRLDVAPRPSFASNLENLLDKESLSPIRRDALARTGHRCLACGSAADVEATERWTYLEPLEGSDETRGLQVLDGFISLCRRCRSAFRVGALMSVAKRRPEVVPSKALSGLARICRWSPDEARVYADGAFSLWTERGRLEWTMDLSLLAAYGPLRIGRGWRVEGPCEFSRRMLAGKPGLHSFARVVGCACSTGSGVSDALPIPEWAENLAERRPSDEA